MTAEHWMTDSLAVKCQNQNLQRNRHQALKGFERQGEAKTTTQKVRIPEAMLSRDPNKTRTFFPSAQTVTRRARQLESVNPCQHPNVKKCPVTHTKYTRNFRNHSQWQRSRWFFGCLKYKVRKIGLNYNSSRLFLVSRDFKYTVYRLLSISSIFWRCKSYRIVLCIHMLCYKAQSTHQKLVVNRCAQLACDVGLCYGILFLYRVPYNWWPTLELVSASQWCGCICVYRNVTQIDLIPRIW